MNRIIEYRKSQSNFQLIVITHDEKFLTHIQGDRFTDHFTEFNEMKVVSQEFIVYLLVEFKKAKKGVANYGATEKLCFDIRIGCGYHFLPLIERSLSLCVSINVLDTFLAFSFVGILDTERIFT